MRTALGVGFGLLVLGAAAVGIARWALNGAEAWYVAERNGQGDHCRR